MTTFHGFYTGPAAQPTSKLERSYCTLVNQYYRRLVEPGARVLELGCGRGDLLASVAPARGVGVDCDAAMIERAKRSHSRLEFHLADATEFALGEQFDYILLSDLLNEVWDVQGFL